MLFRSLTNRSVSEKLGMVKNFVSTLCTVVPSDPRANPNSPHPLARNRLDFVLGTVSELRQARGCSVETRCDLDGGVIQ